MRHGKEEVRGGAFREGRKMGCKRLDEREGKLKGKEGGETNGECGRGRQGSEGERRTGGRAGGGVSEGGREGWREGGGGGGLISGV